MLYAWSEALDGADLRGQPDTGGALRLRLVAIKARPCHDFPYRDADGRYLPEAVLDFDYRGIVPR